jgi:hypothetical protein
MRPGERAVGHNDQSAAHPQGVVKRERGEQEPVWATAVALSRPSA